MSIDTSNLQNYPEQRTGKLQKKPVYIPPMNVIKQMKKADDITKVKKYKK
jgi:hypothetical protein